MRKRSLYFEDRKEYYRRKNAGFNEEFYKIKVKTNYIGITYFVNFNIEENIQYLNGSLSSPNNIPIADAKKIIKANLPTGYTPTGYYKASGRENQEETILIMWREDEEIFKEVLHV